MNSYEKNLTRVQAARRADIVEKLLPIVEELLEERESYASLSVEEIIQRAGIVRSTFYRYFSDKNDLLLALSEPAMADIHAVSIAPWKKLSTLTQDELTELIAQSAEAYRPHVTFMYAMVEASAYDPQVKKQFIAFFDGVRKAVGRYISDGQQSGRFRVDIDADATAGWFTWMVERGTYQMIMRADENERMRLIRSLAAIMWYTLIGEDGFSGE